MMADCQILLNWKAELIVRPDNFNRTITVKARTSSAKPPGGERIGLFLPGGQPLRHTDKKK